jgi:multidrug efflux system membrane fusion protein
VEAFSRDGGARLAAGKLALIDNQVNQQTATIKLKAVFPNPDKALWPNAFLKVRLLLATRHDALVVPAAAIQRGPQGPFVYVVGADKKAVMHPVGLEPGPDDVAIIEHGVEPGADVVVEGQNALKPGATVAPRPAQSRVRGGAPP